MSAFEVRGSAIGEAEAPLALRFNGSVDTLSADDRRALFERSTSSDATVRERTAEIIARVRRDGDAALRVMAREFDGVELEALEVPRAEWMRALDRLDAALLRAMERAARNIEAVHRAFLPIPIETSPEPGIVVGRRPDALGRVGVYAPGGRAAYPSSVLMGAIPARVAGVGEVILASPPERGSDGTPSAVVLAAAALAGVDRVFALGGAGAMAAMAYGTRSMPRVDRIVGPGNAYVAEAKLQLSGAVAIDSPAGPSELLVIAGASADPVVVARELVAQAEHDPLACVVAATVGEPLARAVARELARLVPLAPRRAIIERALAGQGGVLWAASLDEAVVFANAYAAEHLLLVLEEPALSETLARVRNAGTVFVGEAASVAFGDYMTGANHVLPTGGLARCYSGLSTLDFVRWTTYQRVDREAAAGLAGVVGTFAEAEGLPGHAAAARGWSPGAERRGEEGGDEGTGDGRGKAAAVGVRARGAPPYKQDARFAAAKRDQTPAPDSISLQSLARPEIEALPLYAPDQAATCTVDVSDNTNLWGMPPAAARALRDCPTSAVTRYPTLYAGTLGASLLAYLGLDGSDVGVVTGCGSDDVLDAAMRAFGAPGDAIAFSAPTFSMIPTFARINGLDPRAVPLRPDLDVDAERLVDTGAKLIYLCAPNNPTGTTISRAAIEYVVAHAPGVVILDEAYAEFASASHVDLVAGSERLLVTRTLSKAFGLAGLRVGYGVSSRELAALITRARGPYKVNALAERAAVAALAPGDEGRGWVARHVALAKENRARLGAELTRRGLAPLPSQGNFVFVPTARARVIAAGLRQRGVLVRTHAGLPTDLAELRASNGEALRIGIGPWEMMQTVLDALDAVLRTPPVEVSA